MLSYAHNNEFMKKINGIWTAEGDESQEHINRYVFAAQYIKDKIVLDAACGNGFGSFILAQSAKEVYGIDFEEKLVGEAKGRYGKENISFSLGNVAALAFPEAMFDVVVSLETIEHLDGAEQRQFLSVLKKILKPEGIIIMSTPDKSIWKELVLHQHDHKKELTQTEFASLLREYFGELDIYGQRFYDKNQAASVRGALMVLKKLDVFNLRRLVPRSARRKIDAGTTPLSADVVVRPLARGQLAACMIAVTRAEQPPAE